VIPIGVYIVATLIRHLTTAVVTKVIVIVAVSMVGHIFGSAFVAVVISIGVYIVATLIRYLTTAVVTKVIVIVSVSMFGHIISSAFVALVIPIGVYIVAAFICYFSTTIITKVVVVIAVSVRALNRIAAIIARVVSILVLMPHRINHFPPNENRVANLAILTLGQAGLGASSSHSLVNDLGVTLGSNRICLVRISANGASICRITVRSTSRCGYDGVVFVSECVNLSIGIGIVTS
jgi:hypothetical protein